MKNNLFLSYGFSLIKKYIKKIKKITILASFLSLSLLPLNTPANGFVNLNSLQNYQYAIELFNRDVGESKYWKNVSFVKNGNLSNLGQASLAMSELNVIRNCKIEINDSRESQIDKMLMTYTLWHELGHCADNELMPSNAAEKLMYRELQADLFATLMLIKYSPPNVENTIKRITFYKVHTNSAKYVEEIASKFKHEDLKNKSYDEILHLAFHYRKFFNNRDLLVKTLKN